MKAILTSAAIAAALAVAGTAQASIVQNGSFEDLTGGDVANSGGSNWTVFNSIPGWDTADGSGIEIQTNATLGFINAQDGNNYVELDSHPNPDANSTMRQVVDLGVGSYVLRFFYSPRTTNPGTNGVEYSIGNVGDTPLTGAITGPSAEVPRKAWTEVVAGFRVETAGLYNLDFRAVGTEDTLGGLIDNVSIEPVPLPAGVMLLLTAIGGLFAVRKRQAA